MGVGLRCEQAEHQTCGGATHTTSSVLYTSFNVTVHTRTRQHRRRTRVWDGRHAEEGAQHRKVFQRAAVL